MAADHFQQNFEDTLEEADIGALRRDEHLELDGVTELFSHREVLTVGYGHEVSPTILQQGVDVDAELLEVAQVARGHHLR